MSLSYEHLGEIIWHCNFQDWKILIQFLVSHTDMFKQLSTKENT